MSRFRQALWVLLAACSFACALPRDRQGGEPDPLVGVIALRSGVDIRPGAQWRDWTWHVADDEVTRMSVIGGGCTYLSCDGEVVVIEDAAEVSAVEGPSVRCDVTKTAWAMLRDQGYFFLDDVERNGLAAMFAGRAVSKEVRSRLCAIEAQRILRDLRFPWQSWERADALLEKLARCVPMEDAACLARVNGLRDEVAKARGFHADKVHGPVVAMIVGELANFSSGTLWHGGIERPGPGVYDPAVFLRQLPRRELAILGEFWNEPTWTRCIRWNTDTGTVHMESVGDVVQWLAGIVSGKQGVGREEFLEWCR